MGVTKVYGRHSRMEQTTSPHCGGVSAPAWMAAQGRDARSPPGDGRFSQDARASPSPPSHALPNKPMRTEHAFGDDGSLPDGGEVSMQTACKGSPGPVRRCSPCDRKGERALRLTAELKLKT
ncbi:hypothetical protein SKAU_G00052060 [Synaphobranchus kaupii]|uniref:Uncharacterized protein n=1 Tax=Synaphobranchus kaupii TaxID=118154 RepID=A0A9Q1J8Q9_SYNKA|nr:hypothetical protein SKAU_G00052060 [Synaphobranchus kaupii]